MNKTFIINGVGGSGKDAFITLFKQHCDNFVNNISSIDPIKAIAEYGGWRGGKLNKDRKFLSDLKKVFIDYNELPRDFILDHIKQKHYDEYLFIHIREGEEIDKIKQVHPEIKTILINRNVDKKGNDSDDMVYDYQYDYIIFNYSDINDLEESVKLFYMSLQDVS